MLAFHPFEGTLDDWGDVLATFPDAEVFQTPAWIRFIAESHRATPVIAVLRDGSDDVGYFAGLTLRKLGIKILGLPFIGWTTDFMGIRLRDGVAKRAAIEALAAFRLPATRLPCTSNSPTATSCRTMWPAWASRPQPSISYLVDLKPDEDVIYQRFSSKSCRYPIRKAGKEGMVIEEARDDAFANEYYAQLEDVFAKQNLVPTYGPDRVRLLIKHLLAHGQPFVAASPRSAGHLYRDRNFPGNQQDRRTFGAMQVGVSTSTSARTSRCTGMPCVFGSGGAWKSTIFAAAATTSASTAASEVQRFLLRKSKYRWTAMARDLAFRLFKLNQRMLGFGKASGHSEKGARR